MSSNGFAAPLRLDLQPSHYQLFYLIYAHGISLLAVLWPTSLSLAVQLLLVGCVLGSAGWFWLRERQQLSHSSTQTWIWRQAQLWRNVATGQDWRLQNGYFLSPWLIIVTLQNAKGKRISLRIWRDQLTPQEYRNLYRRLKFWRELPDQAGLQL